MYKAEKPDFKMPVYVMSLMVPLLQLNDDQS